MKVYPIKAFSDNYIWMMEKNQQVIVVDPGESAAVLAYIKEQNLQLTAILLTHKHNDHVGGVGEILEQYPDTPVYGPSETVFLANHVVKEGETFEVLGQTFNVLKTAGHTEEHISYLANDALFCGDALFSGGCGRVFTGDYEAQYEALQKFKNLDDKVKVYAGHEYTETNLKFAQSVEPDNKDIAKALEKAEELTATNHPTLPTTIGHEKQINLFLRADSLEKFIELRNGRDNF